MNINKLVNAFENADFIDTKQTKLTDFEIEQLVADGYLYLIYKNHVDYELAPTDKLLSYKIRRKEETRQILKKNAFNLAMAIISAMCGSAATLLLQHIFTAL